MSYSISEIFIKLLRSEICGCGISDELREAVTFETLEPLYKISKPQDMTHIVAAALLSNNLISDEKAVQIYKKEQMTAVFRYAQLRHELDRISRAFDAAGVSYMPLKGSVIRKYYPKPEFRTSCDIDILVRAEQLDAASCVVEEKLGFKFDARTAHDISYNSASKTHLELHFDLTENDDEKIRRALSVAWENAELEDGSEYRFVMNPEMLVVYHIIHMAKHFLGGGCGVRPFADLWLLKEKMGYDRESVMSSLSECGLCEFAEQAIFLSEVWFGNEEHTAVTREMEYYLLDSAIYGTIENHVIIEKSRKGGKLGYCLGRLFMPYSKLKRIYPRLERYPILYPFYQVKRWCRFVLRGRLFHARAEIKATNRVADDKQLRILKLCDDLGLK